MSIGLLRYFNNLLISDVRNVAIRMASQLRISMGWIYEQYIFQPLCLQNVRFDAPREEDRLLRDDWYDTMQIHRVKLANIDSINRNRSYCDVIESFQQTEDGALSWSRGTNQCHCGIGFYFQIELLQHSNVWSARVMEFHIHEFHWSWFILTCREYSAFWWNDWYSI